MENSFFKKIFNKDKLKDKKPKQNTVIAEVIHTQSNIRKQTINEKDQHLKENKKSKENIVKAEISVIDKYNLCEKALEQIALFLEMCNKKNNFPFSNDQLFLDIYSQFKNDEKKRFDKFIEEKIEYLKKQNNHYIPFKLMYELTVDIDALDKLQSDIKMLNFEEKLNLHKILTKLHSYIKNKKFYQVRYVDFKSLDLFKDWSFTCACDEMKKIFGSDNKILKPHIERLIDDVYQKKDIIIPSYFNDVSVNTLNSFLVFLEEKISDCQAIKKEQQTKNKIEKSSNEIENYKKEKELLELNREDLNGKTTSTKNSILEINNKLSEFKNCKPILDFVKQAQQSIQKEKSEIALMDKELEIKRKEATNIGKKVDSLEKIKDIYIGKGKNKQKHDNLLDAVKGSKQNLIKHVCELRFKEQFKNKDNDKNKNALFDIAIKNGISFTDQDQVKFKKEYEEYQGYEETLQILENFEKNKDKFEKKFKLEESKKQLKTINDNISALEKSKKECENKIASLKEEATNKVKQDKEFPQKLNSIFSKKKKNKNIILNFIENLFSDNIFDYSTKIIEMENEKKQLSSTLESQEEQINELNGKISDLDNKIKSLKIAISKKQIELQNKNEELNFIEKVLPLEDTIKEVISSVKSIISRFNQLKCKILSKENFLISVDSNTIKKVFNFGQMLGAFIHRYKKNNGIDSESTPK